MSDLISRAEAIKAIEDLQDSYNGFSDTYDKACIIGVLEELPSAEPQIVRCEECWRRNKEGYCPLVIDGCYPPDLPDDWYCSDGERRTDDQV